MRSVVNLIVVVGFIIFIFGIFSLIYDKLDKILKALESKSKVQNTDKNISEITWIRADEELPLRSGYYLVHPYNGFTDVMFYSPNRQLWSGSDAQMHDLEEIKLWSILPEVPLDI